MGVKVANGTIPPIQQRSKRRDWDKHRAGVRAANRAYRAAVRQLVEEYREEYDELYAMFAALEDPPVDPTGRGPNGESIEDRIVRQQLDEVARVYRENIEGKPVQAVWKQLGYATRPIAKSRVAWARKAGLLPPTTSRKKRA